MRYLVLIAPDDATTVEADTAAEAARIAAQAVYGPCAGAYPLEASARTKGGTFSIMARAWEGAALALVGRLSVAPMGRVERAKSHGAMLAPRDFPVTRLPRA